MFYVRKIDFVDNIQDLFYFIVRNDYNVWEQLSKFGIFAC